MDNKGAGQRGAALLIVLLITGLATVLAVSLVSSQQVQIRRTANVLAAGQAYWLALGVESFAARVLTSDLQDGKTDHLGEGWAMGLFPTQVEGGVVSGYLEDLQGRFNLNNLTAKNADFQAHSRKQFQRLLSLCNLDVELVQAVEDWVDEDIEPRFPAGAEDGIYGGLTPPYRAANGEMASPTELRLVNGLDAAGFACLEPLVCVLPDTTYVNVNTASPMILASLTEEDKFSLADAEALVAKRGDEGYESVAVFLQEAGLVGAGVQAQFLAVASSYFVARSRVELGNTSMLLHSVLHRKGQGVEVIRRSIGVD